jgi:hypothetical protein
LPDGFKGSQRIVIYQAVAVRRHIKDEIAVGLVERNNVIIHQFCRVFYRL